MMARFRLGYAVVLAISLAIAGLAAPAPLFAQTGSDAGETSPAPLLPRDVPAKQPLSELQAMPQSGSVVVKFREGLTVRKRNGGLSGLASAQGDVLDQAVSSLGLSMNAFERLHTVPEAELDAQRALGQQRNGKQLADLNLYFTVPVPPGQTAAEVADRLNTLDFVEFAEPAPVPAPAPVDITPTTPDYSGQQGYKGAAPTGINVNVLAGLGGVDGTGVRIVDVEYSWQLDHEDLELPNTRIVNVGATPVDPFGDTDHGTAVLGEMVGKANAYGVTGIVPGAEAHVAAANTTSGYNPAAAITAASNAISPGDVILIEQQYWVCGTGNYGPLEVLQSVFDAVSNATAAGRIVVAAAGNGNVDLDQAGCNNLFDRATRDSGAIIVGAGSSSTRTRLSFSSYGSRVDVQGWGHNVTTTGYGALFDGGGDIRQRYTAGFSGTSSASPIVAGAVAAIQGRLASCGQSKLTPAQMRAKLVQFGSDQTNPQTGHIGPLPDVGRTLNSYSCGAGSDLVVSGFSGSTSTAETGAPITLNAVVANQGNATSSSTTLRYYLSNDATISPLDTQLGTDAVAALAAGGSEADNAVVTIGTAGNYWLGACADSYAGEANTSNNCSVGVAVTITDPLEPDLVISAFSRAPSTAVTGDTITLMATVSNNGNASSSQTVLRFFLSSDQSITNADSLLASTSVIALNARGLNDDSEDHTVPVTINTAGSYWVGACVDPSSGETDTGNNCSAGFAITITGPPEPDLVISVIGRSKATPVVGERVTINATVRNDGTATADATTLRYMASSDATIEFSDRQRAFDPIASLGAGATSAQNASIRFNRAGSRWIGACVDSVAGETRAGNNCSGALSVAVGKGDTASTLTAQAQSLAPALGAALAEWGLRVVLTARVQAVAPAAGTPGGRVHFFSGNRRIGSATLVNGGAVLTTTALTLGTHRVRVRYAGSSDWNGSTSARQAVTITPGVGGEFRANRTRADDQRSPAVAANGSGEFLVAWQSLNNDGSGWGIYAQRFDPDASRTGPEFRVNRVKAGQQTSPSVAALEDQGYVVAFEGDRSDRDKRGIRAQRYTRTGTRSGNPFTVNTYKIGQQRAAAVAALKDGGFVIAWQSKGQDGSGWGIFAQRYRANGARFGTEFRVNSTTANDQTSPAIAALMGGGFIITWQSRGQDGSKHGIYAQRYRANNSARGGEFRVNTTTADNQISPVIAALADGGFVVAWQSLGTDGSDYGVYAQRYRKTGATFGAEVRVNTRTGRRQHQPALIALADSGYIVTWASGKQDGSGFGIFGQRFDSANDKQDVEFQVNTTTLSHQLEPAGAPLGTTTAAILWASQGQDGSGFGIFGQRIGVP
ncbi:MAG: CARDB domain-containing protein [Roseovarius sp.]